MHLRNKKEYLSKIANSTSYSDSNILDTIILISNMIIDSKLNFPNEASSTIEPLGIGLYQTGLLLEKRFKDKTNNIIISSNSSFSMCLRSSIIQITKFKFDNNKKKVLNILILFSNN